MNRMSQQAIDANFHLLKRKNRAGEQIYYVGILADLPGKNGRPRYVAVRSTGIKCHTKAGKLSKKAEDDARKAARRMLSEDPSLFASKDEMRKFLLTLWTPGESEYIRSKHAEGRSISPDYCANNRQLIETYFLPYFEDRKLSRLSDLNRQNLLQWRNYLYEHQRLKAPYYDEQGQKVEPRKITAATQNKVRQAVWVALQWAVDIGLLPFHPGQGVGRVHTQPKERQIFEPTELQKLFSQEWADDRCKAAAALAAETGLRLGELRGLLWGAVRLEDRELDVVRSWQNSQGLKPPKWGRSRLRIPIPDLSAELLEKLRTKNRWGAGADSFVFYQTDRSDRPLSSSAIQHGLERAVKAAELPEGRTFHSLRHSWISHCNLPDHILRHMVGHTNAETTALYQHVTDKDREAIREYQRRIVPFDRSDTA